MPDYVDVVLLARHANVSPMELLEWPALWVERLRNVIEAEAEARRQEQQRP